MILIPIRILPSPIHGRGLFAGRAVRRGEVVSVWAPPGDVECAPEDVLALPMQIQAAAMHYGGVGGDGVFRISLGPERFINHSDSPNLGGNLSRFRIAIRDVEEGEELVEDYAVYEGVV